MSADIPPSHLDLFENKSLAFLSCKLRNGDSLVNPVWCEFDGTHVNINSVKGCLKDRLMRRYPKVTLCLSDPDSPDRYLEIRGEVTGITEAGGEALIDRLAQRYMGVTPYPDKKPGEVRIVYSITARKVVAFP